MPFQSEQEIIETFNIGGIKSRYPKNAYIAITDETRPLITPLGFAIAIDNHININIADRIGIKQKLDEYHQNLLLAQAAQKRRESSRIRMLFYKFKCFLT